jgi:hypothetical protein
VSIATAILADAPRLYWKLDDPTGPAASDSSGFAQPGVYSGTFQLGQPGPEISTNSALLLDRALIYSLNQSPVFGLPESMECWLATESLQTAQNTFLDNGRGVAPTTGMSLAFAAGSGLNQPVNVIINGIATGVANGNILVGAWHHVVLTKTAAFITNIWIDGVNTYVNVNTGANTGLNAGDKVQIGANLPGQLLYLAHVALYNVALTAAQVAAHFAANTTPQGPQPVSAVTSGTTTALQDILSAFVARDLRNTP